MSLAQLYPNKYTSKVLNILGLLRPTTYYIY